MNCCEISRQPCFHRALEKQINYRSYCLCTFPPMLETHSTHLTAFLGGSVGDSHTGEKKKNKEEQVNG